MGLHCAKIVIKNNFPSAALRETADCVHHDPNMRICDYGRHKNAHIYDNDVNYIN